MTEGLAGVFEAVRHAPVHTPVGTVIDSVGTVIEIGGIRAAVGDCLEITTGSGTLPVEIVGFRKGRLLGTPLGSISGIRPGARVVQTHRGPVIPAGEALLGRVLDSFGCPLDGLPLPPKLRRCAVHAAPPSPFLRKPITQCFETGIRVLDGFLTLGLGQRVGIFAGAGVGKSTLLGMICRSSQADVNVVALVGERGRELNDFVRNALGDQGLARSVVVAATSDQPPLVRARGAEAATAIAEYFRDQGKSVLLIMDSVTRYAMALRETALAAGEPPATKGYTPSVFAALPKLLERAGTGAGTGVITALYTVLVEGDDLSDPIADAVRGILDGHIVLSRSLAERGFFPAVDVLSSVSRVAPDVADPGLIQDAAALRSLLGAYRDVSDLIQVGAYVEGSNPHADIARRMMPHIEQLCRQDVNDKRTGLPETRARFRALASQGGKR